MPRLPALDPAETTGEVQALLEGFRRQRGNVPNLFRTLAVRPEVALTAAAHMKAVLAPGEVPVRLKELLAVRVSQINDCDY